MKLPTLIKLRTKAAPTPPLPLGEGGPQGRVRERSPGSCAQFVAAARPGGLTWRVVTLSLLSALSACAHDDIQTAVPAAALPTVATPAETKPAETKAVETTPPHAEPTAVPGDAAGDVGRPSRPPDHEQPIHIKADRIEINQKKSTTLYIGRVSFTQGGLRISADRAEASYKGDKIDTVIASGKPVTLFQKGETPGQDLHASALRLEYHALDNKADLFDEVRLQQGTNVVLCKTLHYDLAESTLSAEGDGADSRVTVTIESSSIEKPAPTKPVPGTQKRNRP
jgi:lipopolysaccharide export system protein LptA